MPDFFITFLYPYFAFLRGAAFNVQQSVEGAGLASSNFLVRDSAGHIVDSYWSPAQAAFLPLGVLILYSMLLFSGFCIAGYALERKKGFGIALVVACLPGICSALGYWPDVGFMPKVYHIGGVGSLGSPNGMAALAIIALLTGWVSVVIATDALSLQDRFRHAYDHFWYSMAILAGLFFVADAGTSQETRDLQDTTKHVHQASSYLLSQVREYARYCKAESIENKASCIWANGVQQELVDYTVNGERLYWQFGPRSLGELYSPFRAGNEEVQSEIREELEKFNQLQCPTSKNQYALPSGTCQRPPAQFCTGTQDAKNMIRAVAVSNECVIPTLIMLRSSMERQYAHVEAATRSKHARWLFYLLFAILAGGKVANATAKLTKPQPGVPGLGDERNVWRLARTVWKAVQFVVRLASGTLQSGFWFAKRVALGSCGFPHLRCRK